MFLSLSPSSSRWPCWRLPLPHHEGTIIMSSLVVRDTENKFPVPWVHEPQRSSRPLKDWWALNLSLFFFAPTSSPCLGYRCSLKYLPVGKQKGGPRECKMWEAWATPIRMGLSFLNWLNSGWLLPLSFPFLFWCCSCMVVRKQYLPLSLPYWKFKRILPFRITSSVCKYSVFPSFNLRGGR